jgi:hypothetical protein
MMHISTLKNSTPFKEVNMLVVTLKEDEKAEYGGKNP